MTMLTAASIVLAAAILVALAIAAGYILGWANRKFHVEVDPTVAEITAALPGANCGGCGFVGCGEYAEAVAAGRAEVTLCAPGGQGAAAALAEIMGVEAGQAVKMLAVVHCRATADERLHRSLYEGEATCAAANLVSAVQGCSHGCLGLGDCAKACDYGALRIVDGLATVIAHKCIGCGKCAAACPRGVISLVPLAEGRTMYVACSNPDFGPDVKRICDVGCIGCKACTKVGDAIEMKGNLPRIDYARLPNSAEQLQAIAEKCPAGSLTIIGLKNGKIHSPGESAAGATGGKAAMRPARPLRRHSREKCALLLLLSGGERTRRR